MKVKDLKEELEDFDDEAKVAQVFGSMQFTTAADGRRHHRFLSHPLMGVTKGVNGDCLLLFDKLKSGHED